MAPRGELKQDLETEKTESSQLQDKKPLIRVHKRNTSLECTSIA